MQRLLVAVFCLLFLGLVHFAASQTGETVVVIPQGLHHHISASDLVGVSVGDIHVLRIERFARDGVVVSTAKPGNSFVELTRRGGKKQIIRVQVIPVQSVRPRTVGGVPASRTEGPVAPALEQHERAQSDTQITPAALTRGSQSNREPTTPGAPKPIPQGRGLPNQPSFLSRVEISAESFFLIDKEQLRIVGSEALVPELGNSEQQQNEAANISGSTETLTVRRTSVVMALSVALDLDSRTSVSASFPFIRREDVISFGGRSAGARSQGLGDIELKLERTYPRVFNTRWDGLVEFALGVPTGKSIYNSAEDKPPLGIGHYEVGGVLGARRVFERFVFNARGGVHYTVPRTFEAVRVSPGIGYSAQTGVGVAINDGWSLSQQLQYIKAPNVFLNSALDRETINVDQSYISHGVLYRLPRGGHAFRMFFNLGLNPASSDYGVGLTYTYRPR